MNAQRDEKYKWKISLRLPGIEPLIIQSAPELKRKVKELNLVSEEVIMAEEHVEDNFFSPNATTCP
jgi:hypothetical protein